MSEWERVKLGEICDVRDGTHASPKETNTGRLLVTSKNLLGGLLSLDNAHYISSSDAAEIDKRSKVDQWDVLFSMIGTVGEVAIIREAPDFVIKNVGLFKTQGNESLANWIYYFFRSRNGRNEIRARLKGTSQQYISLGELRNFPIPCPPLATQRRITSILSNYDSAIANCRRQIVLLEEAAMRLYKEWFKDGKGAKKRLWDVCDYFRGVSYSSEQIATPTGVPLITLKNIERFGGFHEDRSKFFSGSCKQDSLASGGDVLMAVTDMTKERRLVGHVALVPDTYETAPYSMDLIKLKGKDVQDLFLYALLRYTNYSGQFAVRASGANVLHLKPSSLDDISILVPPSKLQESFLSVFQPMVKQKNCLSRQICALTEARDRLLPKLMKGEIAV